MNTIATTTTDEATMEILGQFYFALGQGAGSIRIRRSAISALRARYEGPIRASVHEWDAAAPNVLAFLTQIGRLAALLATESGRAAISADDFMRARQAVEASVHHTAESTGKLFAGPFCPPVPGEQPPAPRPTSSEVREPLDAPAAAVTSVRQHAH